jgi:hypothetical protein
MKTSTIPVVRVEPELREQLEQVLREGESLSAFVEASVRETVRQRLDQAEFIKRGLTSLVAARDTGSYVPAQVVVDKLQVRLDKARSNSARRRASGR